MPRRLVSPKRLAANRANAAKSTGPRTPQGKAHSSQNARKHIFTASTFAVVRLEDLQGFTGFTGTDGTFPVASTRGKKRPVCPARSVRPSAMLTAGSREP